MAVQGNRIGKDQWKRMDLNDLPPEFDYHFLDESDGNSTYCTQAAQASVQGAVHDIAQGPEQQVLPALGSVEAAVGNYNIAENPKMCRLLLITPKK